MKLSKKNQILVLSLSVVVLVLIVLRVAGVFPPIEENATGTIGNVEKVDRFRGQQMKMEDIKCDNPEVAKFVQSAGFQNMMKDENFQAVLANPAQMKFVPMAVGVNGIISQAAQDFHSFLEKGDNAKAIFGSIDYQQFYEAFNPSGLLNLPEPIGANTSSFLLPNAQDFQRSLFNSDFQKFVNNFDFKVVYNQDIQGIFGADFVKFLAGDFQAAMDLSGVFPDPYPVNPNIDFQSVLQSEAFQNLFTSQEFQKLVQNQEFQKFLSQGFQIIYLSQSFQTFVGSQEFQNALKNMETNKLGL